MLANKRGGEVLKYLPRLVEGGIAVNCQLVLCRGVNDGDEDVYKRQARRCCTIPASGRTP